MPAAPVALGTLLLRLGPPPPASPPPAGLCRRSGREGRPRPSGTCSTCGEPESRRATNRARSSPAGQPSRPRHGEGGLARRPLTEGGSRGAPGLSLARAACWRDRPSWRRALSRAASWPSGATCRGVWQRPRPARLPQGVCASAGARQPRGPISLLHARRSRRPAGLGAALRRTAGGSAAAAAWPAFGLARRRSRCPGPGIPMGAAAGGIPEESRGCRRAGGGASGREGSRRERPRAIRPPGTPESVPPPLRPRRPRTSLPVSGSKARDFAGLRGLSRPLGRASPAAPEEVGRRGPAGRGGSRCTALPCSAPRRAPPPKTATAAP